MIASKTIALCALVVLLGSGVGLAQTQPPATGAAAAAPAPAAPEKTAVSKACSQQADAKGLHGKARKTFRSECKKNGGKTT